MPRISVSQSSSNRQKEHRLNFRTKMPYRSLGSKASLRFKGNAHRTCIQHARKQVGREGLVLGLEVMGTTQYLEAARLIFSPAEAENLRIGSTYRSIRALNLP